MINTREACLVFSYHMWGNQMGQLKVIQVINGARKVLWKMSGDRGNRWYRHQIYVRSSWPYKVIV